MACEDSKSDVFEDYAAQQFVIRVHAAKRHPHRSERIAASRRARMASTYK